MPWVSHLSSAWCHIQRAQGSTSTRHCEHHSKGQEDSYGLTMLLLYNSGPTLFWGITQKRAKRLFKRLVRSRFGKDLLHIYELGCRVWRARVGLNMAREGLVRTPFPNIWRSEQAGEAGTVSVREDRQAGADCSEQTTPISSEQTCWIRHRNVWTYMSYRWYVCAWCVFRLISVSTMAIQSELHTRFIAFFFVSWNIMYLQHIRKPARGSLNDLRTYAIHNRHTLIFLMWGA